MTNEELAKNIEYTAEELPNYGGFECAKELREAAARLRMEDDVIDNKVREIADLRRRLKVAEDALESVIDDCDSGYELVTIARNALAAIREKGGANA